MALHRREANERRFFLSRSRATWKDTLGNPISLMWLSIRVNLFGLLRDHSIVGVGEHVFGMSLLSLFFSISAQWYEGSGHAFLESTYVFWRLARW